MLAELFKAVFDRLDTRYQPTMLAPIIDPATGAEHIGYFKSDGSLIFPFKGLPDPKYPAVTVYSQQAMISYIERHFLTEEMRSILTVNRTGLRAVQDYVFEGEVDRREHVVTFPAAFDEECAAAASAITGALGKWITLDAFDSLLDKCAAFVANFTALEEAASNMEGHETAKVVRTRTGHQAQVTGDVSCTVEIPRSVSVNLLFMGTPISAEIPLRLKVDSKQIMFYLVDNGAIAKAQMEALRAIKAGIVAAFPNLLVIDGNISA